MSVLHYLRNEEDSTDFASAYGGQAVEYRVMGQPFTEEDARRFRTVVISAEAKTEAQENAGEVLRDVQAAEILGQIKALNPFVYVVGYAMAETIPWHASKALGTDRGAPA